MTDSIYLRRRRRTPADDDEIPEDIQQWFSGELPASESPPWNALLAPSFYRLGEYWQKWRREHPRAVAPPGLAGLLDDDQ